MTMTTRRRTMLVAAAATMFASRASAFQTAPMTSSSSTRDGGPLHLFGLGGPASKEATAGGVVAAPVQLPHTISSPSSPLSNHLLPVVTRITSAEQYLEFLDQDDRLCVINFRASWCKACHRFAPKLRHIVQTYGDEYQDAMHHSHAMTENSHLGLVRFADVEFQENEHLCHVLDVERMPCVHLYSKSKLVQSIHEKTHMHTKVVEALQSQLKMDPAKELVEKR